MKCRKWLPALLAVLLLTLTLPGLAEEQLWSYDSGNMCLELKGSVSGDVTIPAEVDGYPVNALQYSIFNSNHEITSLTMPDSLRAIQEGAISWMDGLTSVKLNDGLEYIGSTFHNCGALTFGDTLYVNFIRNIREPDLELHFFRVLQRLGIPAEVESNQPD